jgi:hypothetical protein
MVARDYPELQRVRGLAKLLGQIDGLAVYN